MCPASGTPPPRCTEYLRQLAPFGSPSLVAIRNFMKSMQTANVRTGSKIKRMVSEEVRIRAKEWTRFIRDGCPLTNSSKATAQACAYSDACEWGLGGWDPATTH